MIHTLSPRELAWKSLLKCEKNGKYSNLELDSVLKKHPLSPADKNLYTTLFYGVVERRITLDYYISRYSTRDLTSLSPSVRNLLRLGLYQIYYLDRIPDNAAVNESVKLIKKTKEANAAPFINAVLRAACRHRDKGIEKDPALSEQEQLSVEYSFPLWMVQCWTEAYGLERCKQIMAEQNKRAPLTLRVNTLVTSRETLMDQLKKRGVNCEECSENPYALRVLGNYSLAESEELKNGLFFVQDLASQIACERLNPQPEETVLDVCCCPGGKSFSAAMLMKDRGTIYSMDLHSSKLSLVNKGADTLSIHIITTMENDSTLVREEWVGMADRVICDVPCSGLGVISKKPDIRQKTEEEISRLPLIQSRILASSSRYLKIGGTLLYSTCTLNPQENEQITQRFLTENPNFIRDPRFPTPLTIFPEGGNTDGFFIDLLVRTE